MSNFCQKMGLLLFFFIFAMSSQSAQTLFVYPDGVEELQTVEISLSNRGNKQLPLTRESAWVVSCNDGFTYFQSMLDVLKRSKIITCANHQPNEPKFCKNEERVYYCPYFILLRKDSAYVFRLYFDISDILPIYREAMKESIKNFSAFKKLIDSVKDKRSADKAAAHVEELYYLFRCGSKGSKVYSPIFWYIMAEHGISDTYIWEEILRIVMNEYYGSEILKEAMRPTNRPVDVE